MIRICSFWVKTKASSRNLEQRLLKDVLTDIFCTRHILSIRDAKAFSFVKIPILAYQGLIIKEPNMQVSLISLRYINVNENVTTENW